MKNTTVLVFTFNRNNHHTIDWFCYDVRELKKEQEGTKISRALESECRANVRESSSTSRWWYRLACNISSWSSDECFEGCVGRYLTWTFAYSIAWTMKINEQRERRGDRSYSIAFRWFVGIVRFSTAEMPRLSFGHISGWNVSCTGIVGDLTFDQGAVLLSLLRSFFLGERRTEDERGPILKRRLTRSMTGSFDSP